MRKNMTEAEIKTALLRYNKLSEERAGAAYMWRHAGESGCYDYESRWSICMEEMSRIRDELHECGYELASTGYKKVGKVQHEEYKIVPANS